MWRRIVIVLGLLPVCWLGMMLVHECGHMLAAVVTGGTVTRMVWPLWGFSRTDVGDNPHPLVVVWAGPLGGAMVPLAILLAGRMVQRKALRGAVSLEIFSGFCLLANGLYLSAGAIGRIGDAGDLLRGGVPIWLLWTVGLPLAGIGLWQWHRLGSGLGLAGMGNGERWIVVGLALALVVVAGMWGG